MKSRAADLNVQLRPHVKTAKCRQIAKLATTGNTPSITVSTLTEAEYFADAGFQDIVYAVCITPDKLDRAASIAKHTQLHLITDCLSVADDVANHSSSHRVFIEIDCGEHRTGVLPESDELLQIAERLTKTQRSRLSGVLTHAGHSYACRNEHAMRAIAEEERAAAVLAAERLRAEGYEVPIVSVGSTPTACFAEHLQGVTEMRPGVYLLGDLFQAGIGTCGLEDIAATVLTSVISRNLQTNTLVIDAGGLALSKDRSTQSTDFDAGFGRVARIDEGTPMDGVFIHEVHQEHGLIRLPEHLNAFDFPVGTRLRVYPNHICMTAAMYSHYEVYGTSLQITERWPRTNGWT